MADETQEPRKVVLGSNTFVSISIVGMIVAGTAWTTRLDSRVQALEREIAQLRDGIVNANGTYLSADGFATWMRLLQVQNPQLSVPSIR